MYETAAGFRQAIEARLNERARTNHVEVNRLRRGLVFERIMVRLAAAEPRRSPPFASTLPHELKSCFLPRSYRCRVRFPRSIGSRHLRLRSRTLEEAISQLRSFWRDARGL